MALIDVTCSSGAAAAEIVRFAYPDVQILVMANVRVSPLRYLKPSIRPAALLLRPSGREEYVKTVLKILKGNSREAAAIRDAIKHCFGLDEPITETQALAKD